LLKNGIIMLLKDDFSRSFPFLSGALASRRSLADSGLGIQIKWEEGNWQTAKRQKEFLHDDYSVSCDEHRLQSRSLSLHKSAQIEK
jgi:hypothetical protein